ncbi:MAG: hypothetical protein QM660_15580 [Dysgonomonas sp.]
MRKARRSWRFTAIEQALFYELVAICNGEDWPTVFDCSNIELCCALDINKNTLIKSRETLINSGLLFYKSGKSKRSVSQYSFSTPFETSLKIKPDKGTVGGTDKGTVGGTEGRHLYKQETETKLSPYNPPKGYENFNFEFLDFEFRECMTSWLKYKSAKGQKYKDQESLEIFYKNKMIKASGGRPEIVVQMIEEARSNNWAGLFPLKEKNGGQNAKHPITDYSNRQEYTPF